MVVSRNHHSTTSLGILLFIAVMGTGSCAQGEELLSNILNDISADDANRREKAYCEFAEHTRKYMGKTPLPKAAKLFEAIVALNSTPHAYRVMLLLRRYPKDPNVLATAQRILLELNAAPVAILSALVYVEKHDELSFLNYFEERKYDDISVEIRTFMASSKPVCALKRNHIAELVCLYQTSRNPNQRLSARKELIAMDSDVVDWIMLKYQDRSNQPLDLGLVWLLGEMNDTGGFNILFRDYLSWQSFRTAISIGSCLAPEKVPVLFDMKYWSSEASLKNLLKDIYGDKWENVQSLSLEDLQSHLYKNIKEIRAECQKRSIPQYD